MKGEKECRNKLTGKWLKVRLRFKEDLAKQERKAWEQIYTGGVPG